MGIKEGFESLVTCRLDLGVVLDREVIRTPDMHSDEVRATRPAVGVDARAQLSTRDERCEASFLALRISLQAGGVRLGLQVRVGVAG